MLLPLKDPEVPAKEREIIRLSIEEGIKQNILQKKGKWEGSPNFSCVSISSTFPGESVPHFQISIPSVFLDPHGESVDHGMQYIF